MKIYKNTLELCGCNCDMCGTWRPSAILEAMQETAGAHSALCGLGRETMDSLGLAWILSRSKIEFTRIPCVGEKVLIETYPMPTRHTLFPRSHRFYDETGTEIGCANSLWALLDIQDRHIVKSEYVQGRIPDNSDMCSAAGMPATVRAFEGDVKIGHTIPQFTDFDVNVHVNNTKYLDWCCNALGIEIMQANCLLSFDVNYDSEIRPGCEIRTELTMQDNLFAFCGFAEDKRRFGIRGRLTPRT